MHVSFEITVFLTLFSVNCLSGIGKFDLFCFQLLFAVFEMMRSKTFPEWKTEVFASENKRFGVLFEMPKRLRANVQAFCLKCQDVFRHKSIGFPGIWFRPYPLHKPCGGGKTFTFVKKPLLVEADSRGCVLVWMLFLWHYVRLIGKYPSNCLCPLKVII